MSNLITPLNSKQRAAQEQTTLKEGYVHKSLVARDQFATVLTGGNPDETISSRSARAAVAA